MSGEQAQPAINWVQIILSTVGISAVVSGAVSASLNYFLTMRQLGKQRKMGLIQEKLDLLSSMIYHLDKMKYKYDAIAFMHQQTTPQERYAFNQDEWNELVRDIDEKIKNRYYLLNRKVLEKWVWAKNLRTHPKSIEIMPELRKMLVEEYNQIIDKHLNNLQDIVPKITPDEETGSRDKQTDAQESPIK